jgi:hypothetical protein
MTRQNPLPPASNNDEAAPIKPIDVASLISLQTAAQQQASKEKRTRTWEKNHRTVGYLIPVELHVRAKEIREKMNSIANEHLTTVSSVASAFMQYSLSHLHANKLTLMGRPKAERRTLTLHWTESQNGWPKEIKQVKRNNAKKNLFDPPPLYLGHRWGGDIDAQIIALRKKTAVCSGEIVVYLLGYALDAYQSGRLHLHSEAVTVANQVSPIHGSEN